MNRQVQELVKAIKENPDVMLVTPGHDHSYVSVQPEVTTAIRSRYGLSEDFGQELDEEEARIKVICFR
jgi:hypothetical protein